MKTNINRLQVEYGVIGLSIGDFDYCGYKDELECFVKESLFFYSRDKYTADYLNGLAGETKVVYSADVVFSNENIKRIETNKETIGVNFRDVPYKDITGDLNWNKWKETLDELEITKVIADASLEQRKLGINYDSNYAVEDVIKQLNEIDVVVAMRFHVVLVAALLGKIPIPIDYCPKVSRLSYQLGIEELILHINDSDKLKSTIEYVKDNKEQLLDTINKNTKLMINKSENMFNDIKNVLEERL